jgi:aspartyl-tRNA(Asn)/glutamyl-tRNA(Gln) amidotransferase subunit C
MSEIDKKVSEKIFRLARIENFSDDTSKQIGGIIAWVEQLNEVDTDNVEPLTNVHEMSLRLNKDEVLDGEIAEQILKNAKDAKYGYFAVPKVIE